MKPDTLKFAHALAKMARERSGINIPEEVVMLTVRFVDALSEVKDDDRVFHEWLRCIMFASLTLEQKKTVVEAVEREIKEGE